MAIWNKLGSGNVEDRRGTGAALGGGGLIIGIIALLASSYFGVSIDPSLIEQFVGTTSSQTEQPAEFQGADDYEKFASNVLGSTNTYWTTALKGSATPYTEPRLVLFRSGTQSGCGIATTQVGPHYCPTDTTIYLDETFFDTIKQLGGSNGDVSQAYVIAHEVGHHVQNVTGTMDTVTNDPNYQRSGENSLSVKLELQADCYAGLWAHSLKGQGVFDDGEINEAIATAEAIGDDRIQSETQGSINPETWTHGSSADRVAAFNKGYGNGNLGECRAYIQ
ncbi:MAG: neutral zinc metallopeptidase [Candidatus Saccharimonadales bacterium]